MKLQIGHREKTQQNTEQTGKRRKALILSAFILTPLLALLVVYIVGLGRYQSCFLNGTMIDEMDVSGMTISEMEEQIGKYSLRVIERQADGTALEEEILGSEIGISYVSTEQFQAVLQGQNRYLWFLKQNADYRKSRCTAGLPKGFYQRSHGCVHRGLCSGERL